MEPRSGSSAPGAKRAARGAAANLKMDCQASNIGFRWHCSRPDEAFCPNFQPRARNMRFSGLTRKWAATQNNAPRCAWLATHLSPRALTSFASLRQSKIYGLTSSINAVPMLWSPFNFTARAKLVGLQPTVNASRAPHLRPSSAKRAPPSARRGKRSPFSPPSAAARAVWAAHIQPRR